MLYKIFFLITIVLVMGESRRVRGRIRYYEGEDEDNGDGGGGKCPQLIYSKGVGLRCKGSGDDLKCIATCLASHVFKGTGKRRMAFSCKGGQWKPRKQVPQCVSDGKCKFDQVKAGKATCKFTSRKVSCQISCGKQSSRKYVCGRDGSWKPPLPSCVKSSRRGNEGGTDTDNFDEDENTDIYDKEASGRERYGQGRKQQMSRRPAELSGIERYGRGRKQLILRRPEELSGIERYGRGRKQQISRRPAELSGIERYGRGRKQLISRRPGELSGIERYGRVRKQQISRRPAELSGIERYGRGRKQLILRRPGELSGIERYGRVRKQQISRRPAELSGIERYGRGRKQLILRRPGELSGIERYGRGRKQQISRRPAELSGIERYGRGRKQQISRRPGFQLKGQGSKGRRLYGEGPTVGPWTTGDIINCQQLRKPKNARVRCKKQRDSAVVCSAECSGYALVFKGTDKEEMTLKCYYGDGSGRWTPRRNFPDCVNKVITEILERD